MAVYSEYVIPFHLPPLLLEMIANKKMTSKDLEFYIEKIDPEAYDYAQKIDPIDFESIGTDFTNHEEYYRNKVIQDISTEKYIIYELISKQFELFDAFNKYDILTIDEMLSGIYEITPEIVLSMTQINCCETNNNDTIHKYQKNWEKL